jgi:hypothetical protein
MKFGRFGAVLVPGRHICEPRLDTFSGTCNSEGPIAECSPIRPPRRRVLRPSRLAPARKRCGVKHNRSSADRRGEPLFQLLVCLWLTTHDSLKKRRRIWSCVFSACAFPLMATTRTPSLRVDRFIDLFVFAVRLRLVLIFFALRSLDYGLRMASPIHAKSASARTPTT